MRWAVIRRSLKRISESSMASVLEATDVSGGYGEIQILKQVSVSLESGKVTAFVGSNGAGKTTLMRLLSGLIPISRGQVRLDGNTLNAMSTPERLARGLSLVPEGRLVFPDFSVAETLRIGAYSSHARQGWRERADQMYELFPRLRERRTSLAGFLSGGEQQMLALARSLMARPRVLLLDEPTLGLAPTMVKELLSILSDIQQTGVTIGLVEQNVHAALSMADYAYVLEDGEVVMHGQSSELLASPALKAAYMGTDY